MQKFEEIYKRAVERKGSPEAIEVLLPKNIKTANELTSISDDRYLSAMTSAIFKAGFVWKVIESKWPDFEDVFWSFDIEKCALITPEIFENLCQNERIIRNPQKIETVSINASMILEFAQDYGSFANFIANWPKEDFIGLLEILHKKGARLGGQTCQYFLRSIGKDGFVLGKDGIAALIQAKVIDKPATSKTNVKKIQEAYNQWSNESGRNLAEISKILALSTDS